MNPNVNGKLEDIGREAALAILGLVHDGDKRQRSLRQSHVNWLASQMSAGKWRLNGEPIIIGSDGYPLDGQHRLWAVVESGVTVTFLVVRGVDPATFATIDTGVARTCSDVLGMRGEKYVTTKAAALSWLYRHQLGKLLCTSKGVGFTSEIGVKLLEKNPAMSECAEWAQRLKRNAFLKYIHPGAMAFLHFKFSMHDAVKSENFWMQVMAEQPCAHKSGPAMLRQWLTNIAAKQSRPSIEIMAICVKAWRAFLEERTLSYLLWRRVGEQPEPFPCFPGDEDESAQKRRRKA